MEYFALPFRRESVKSFKNFGADIAFCCHENNKERFSIFHRFLLIDTHKDFSTGVFHAFFME